MQCTNHLKQMGLAVHNFHDAQRGLPPYQLEAARAGTFCFLYPYAEQQVLWEMMCNAADDTTDKGLNVNLYSNWWQVQLTDSDRTSFSSVPYMVCPTRRSSKTIVTGTHQPGPASDYAVVVYVIDRTVASGKSTSATGPTNWWHYLDSRANASSTSAGLHYFRGPWQFAEIEGNDCSKWKPATSFSAWVDGTTNQIIIGEKHIPAGAIGRCEKGSGNTDRVFIADCSYMCTDLDRTGSMARVVKRYSGMANLLTSTPKEKDQGTVSPVECRSNDGYGFGSYHSGVCNFLIGDGAVRAFPVTTAEDVLFMLSDVRDGGVAALP